MDAGTFAVLTEAKEALPAMRRYAEFLFEQADSIEPFDDMQADELRAIAFDLSATITGADALVSAQLHEHVPVA